MGLSEWLAPLQQLAQQAAAEIMAVYRRGEVAVTDKADASPLTEADLRAHRVIAAGLQALTPQIPVLSEESALQPWAERRQWSRFWLVDPLDGTREFVSRSGEFTVNIALIEGGQPVLGVVQVPVTGALYYGGPTLGAWCREQGVERRLHTRLPQAPVRLVASRRSGLDAMAQLEQALAREFGAVERVAQSSSLKLCEVAQGSADLYPRLGPTSEWDTAAGHAVLLGAGGCVLQPDFSPLMYHKQDILNPHFLALGSDPARWAFLRPLLA